MALLPLRWVVTCGSLGCPPTGHISTMCSALHHILSRSPPPQDAPVPRHSPHPAARGFRAGNWETRVFQVTSNSGQELLNKPRDQLVSHLLRRNQPCAGLCPSVCLPVSPSPLTRLSIYLSCCLNILSFCVPAPPGPPFTPHPTSSSRKETQQNIPGDSQCKDTTGQGL